VKSRRDESAQCERAAGLDVYHTGDPHRLPGSGGCAAVASECCAARFERRGGRPGAKRRSRDTRRSHALCAQAFAFALALRLCVFDLRLRPAGVSQKVDAPHAHPLPQARPSHSYKLIGADPVLLLTGFSLFSCRLFSLEPFGVRRNVFLSSFSQFKK